MLHTKRWLAHLILSLLAMVAIGGAHAAPVYHVRVDTSAYSGTGWLDLQFNPAMNSAVPATALLSGFTGTLDRALAPVVDGSVQGSLPGPVALRTAQAFNALFQAIELGGVFEFDLTLSDGDGAVFALALYGADQVSALGAGDTFSNSLASFTLDGAPTVFDASMIEITAVPEPPAFWLLLAGLALLAALRGHLVPTRRLGLGLGLGLGFILGTRLH